MENLHGWLKELHTTIDAMNPEGFASYIKEDGAFRFGNMEPVIGRKAIEDAVRYFWTTIKGSQHKIVNAWQNGDYITWQGEVLYTRHDDKQVKVNFVNIFRMEGDKIAEYLIYIDNTPVYA
ncbi:MAG: nuclear transport factor 2 family protein [Ignavibacteria bacterium]|jgi:predicted SnoaL-like aldol condensation-catalyzing enzyme|nr:nuclear transport factor 2 family protein [Ignavibacteria bacterium]